MTEARNYSTLSGEDRGWRPGTPLSDADYQKLLATRLWAKVDRTPGQGPRGDCWEFQGYRDPRGYGNMGCRILSNRKRPERTHRIAYFLTHGPIPEGKHICHKCDNPPCCNPEHLWPGTARQNLRDAQAKGRFPVAMLDTRERQIRVRLNKRQLKILQKARKAKGASIYDMSEMIDRDFSFYSMFENAKRTLNVEHYHFLLRFLDINELSLNVLPSQFYLYGLVGQKAGRWRHSAKRYDRVRAKLFAPSRRVAVVWNQFANPSLENFRADLIRDALKAYAKSISQIARESDVPRHLLCFLLNGHVKRKTVQYLPRLIEYAGLKQEQVIVRRMAA